jgi:hypothetical protein
MCCQIPDGFKVDRKVHGCAIGSVKGGSPSRSVRAHWLVVGAVAGWSPWLGGRNFFPRVASQQPNKNVKHTWHKQHDAGSSMGCPTPRVSGNHRSSASLDDLDSLLLKYQQSNGDT